MSVLVLIVNHNCAEMTIECVSSLRNHVPLELAFTIADNGPRDESKALRSELQDVDVFRLKENQGFAAGVNELLAQVKPNEQQKILILNPDTYCTTDFVSPLIDFFDSQKNVGAVCPTIVTPSNDIWYGGGTFSLVKGGPRHWKNKACEGPQEVTFVTGCALLTTFGKYKIAGGLPVHYFLYFEDAHLSLAMRKHDLALYWIPQARLYHHVSATTDPKSPMYVYLFARNRMWLMRELVPSAFYYLFLILHLFVRLPAALIYFGLIKQNGTTVQAFIQGLEDGFKQAHQARDPRALFK